MRNKLYKLCQIEESYEGSRSKATTLSVVSSMLATEAAFVRLVRTTFVASTIPSLTRSFISHLYASKPKLGLAFRYTSSAILDPTLMLQAIESTFCTGILGDDPARQSARLLD